MLKQTSNDPPPEDVGKVAEVLVAALSNLSAVLLVELAGAALMVVAAPSMDVTTGAIVATGFPLVSTETQGFRSAKSIC